MTAYTIGVPYPITGSTGTGGYCEPTLTTAVIIERVNGRKYVRIGRYWYALQ